jgi:hypothetical protein
MYVAWSTKCSYLTFLFSAAHCTADSACKSRVTITQGADIITAMERGQKEWGLHVTGAGSVKTLGRLS